MTRKRHRLRRFAKRAGRVASRILPTLWLVLIGVTVCLWIIGWILPCRLDLLSSPPCDLSLVVETGSIEIEYGYVATGVRRDTGVRVDSFGFLWRVRCANYEGGWKWTLAGLQRNREGSRNRNPNSKGCHYGSRVRDSDVEQGFIKWVPQTTPVQHTVRMPIVAFGAALLLIAVGSRAIPLILGPFKRSRRGRNRLCAKCGYDLTGNESGRCSECGKETEWVL